MVIEMTLPDVDERKEIIEVHISKAAKSGRLSADVDLDRYKSNHMLIG